MKTKKKNWFANKTHLESCTLLSCVNSQPILSQQMCVPQTKCTNGSISGSYHIISSLIITSSAMVNGTNNGIFICANNRSKSRKIKDGQIAINDASVCCVVHQMIGKLSQRSTNKNE
ncbi:hypothetical protein BLOT_012119 [Blomia tropicalis]|nr:hypothetical protein BLOT_012119 [Blomia tropicalis]